MAKNEEKGEIVLYQPENNWQYCSIVILKR